MTDRAAEEDLLQRIAHDLRSPLNTITGWAEVIRSGSLDDDTRRRAGETILRHARVLSWRLNAALDSWRLSSGALELHRTPCALGALVRSAIDGVRPLLDHRRIGCAATLDETAPRVNVDAERFRFALTALLTYAIRHTPDGGLVTVQLSPAPADGGVSLTIEDQGPPGDEAHFFTPSPTPAGGTRRAFDFCLPLVRDMVVLHGGTLTARAGEDGRGAVLHLTLPS